MPIPPGKVILPCKYLPHCSLGLLLKENSLLPLKVQIYFFKSSLFWKGFEYYEGSFQSENKWPMDTVHSLSKTAIANLQMPCDILPVLTQQVEYKFDPAVKGQMSS